jgi:hypothetical protein
MEKELRRILRQELSAGSDGSSRFLSPSMLFDEFVKKYPSFGAMYIAFHYVLRICDAALHGREVPENLIEEAFQMGFRILGAFKQLGQLAPVQAKQAA